MATSSLIRRQPPPPPATADPSWNRWLHDLTAFIAAGGGVDSSQIPGVSSLQTSVTNLQNEYTALSATVTALNTTVSGHTTSIGTLNTEVSTLNSEVAALAVLRNGSGAPASGLGNNNDWYADTTGNHIYVKVSGAWHEII